MSLNNYEVKSWKLSICDWLQLAFQIKYRQAVHRNFKEMSCALISATDDIQ